MPTYQYTAKDHLGTEFKGVYDDISDVGALRAELGRIGYVLLEARQAKGPAQARGRIGQQDIVAFAYKLSGMYSAGLSVIECLETLEDQAEKEALRQVLGDIRARVEAGTSLRKAFESHREVFSEFFVGMLEAGEAAGKLGEALEMSAAYLEKRAQLRNKIKSAFVYPVSVGVMCIGILSCLLLFVVPVFIKLYRNLHVQLPWPTLVLVNLSTLLRSWGIFVLLGGGAGIWLLTRILKDPQVRRGWDRFKLSMPLLGKLNRLILVSRFIRPFAMLISVGLSVIDALRIAGRIAANEKMSHIADELERAARAGNPVGKALKSHNIFPPIGEQVGKLPEMLAKGVDILDRDITKSIDALIVKLEPALTLVMGLVIGVVLMGVYLPMFDYMTHID
jgi:type II secretory pathway component PulF